MFGAVKMITKRLNVRSWQSPECFAHYWFRSFYKLCEILFVVGVISAYVSVSVWLSYIYIWTRCYSNSVFYYLHILQWVTPLCIKFQNTNDHLYYSFICMMLFGDQYDIVCMWIWIFIELSSRHQRSELVSFLGQ